jgi:hypothetical protein
MIKVNNFFLVNNSNKALIILDSKLNILKRVQLNKEFEIHSIMKSANECEFLLYDFNMDFVISLHTHLLIYYPH